MDYSKYNRMCTEIQASARGFAELGTADSAAVARELQEVHARLARAWEMIQRIEDSEFVNAKNERKEA